MAKGSGLAQDYYYGGFDLSGDTNSITKCGPARPAIDVTGINKSAHERINGLSDGEISFNVLFNDATGQEHDALKGLPSADVLLMYLTGTTRGDPVACLTAKQINFNWSRPADGSLIGSVQALGQGVPVEWGYLLTKKVTHSSATDETGHILTAGAQTTKGGVGFLQHFTADSGTVEYDIEDSSDSANGIDGAWANLLAFSDVATPYDEIAQRVEVTGTVEKYVRASTNGTFSNADFAMSFRRGTAQDDKDLS